MREEVREEVREGGGGGGDRKREGGGELSAEASSWKYVGEFKDNKRHGTGIEEHDGIFVHVDYEQGSLTTASLAMCPDTEGDRGSARFVSLFFRMYLAHHVDDSDMVAMRCPLLSQGL